MTDQEFSVFYKDNFAKLVRFISKTKRVQSSAEDIAQEAFLRYRKYASKKTITNPPSYLFSVAISLLRNEIRFQNRFTKVPDMESLICDFEFETRFVNSKEIEKIQKMLEKYISMLSAKQQRSVRLRYIDDLRFKDVAEIMNTPYDTAKANHRHGVMKLISLLKEDGELTYLQKSFGIFP